MEPHPRELPIPPAATSDPRAVELARIWACGGKQHAVLATGIWHDPAAWGMMLVDLAKHAASSYAQTGGCTYPEALARIKEGLDAEWHNPTDEPKGAFLG